MAPGFELDVGSARTGSSEALYQALKFPQAHETQSLILQAPSPKAAKRIAREHAKDARGDWPGVRVRVMRWCLRVKAVQHASFVTVLLETGDAPIVERSNRDGFWGALPGPGGTLTGKNVLGRLLMELREEVRAWGPDPCVSAPDEAVARLLGAPLPNIRPPQPGLPVSSET